MELDPTRMCLLLVGLPDVEVLGVDDEPGEPLRVHVETTTDRPTCRDCNGVAWVKDRPVVELVDLPCFGRPTRLVWHKYRWECPTVSCPVSSWTEDTPSIASARLVMTDRCGRWVTFQVGRYARSINEIADELDCDWHTINDSVIAYGTALIDDDTDRIGEVAAVGLDEVLFARIGPWHRQHWSTQIVDVGRGQLLDVVAGRSAVEPCKWFENRDERWRDQIEYATLDLSGPYRKVFDTMLPRAAQVADPFHVVEVRHEALCVRGRVRDPPRRLVAAGR